MLSKKFCLFVALIVLLATSTAAADPTHIQTNVPTQICLPDKSKCIDIPEGHFVDNGSWDKIDTVIKTTEDKVTNLTAQNVSLRKSANEVHWLPVAVGIAVGLVAGFYVGVKL